MSFVVEFCFDHVWSTEMSLIEHEPYHGTIHRSFLRTLLCTSLHNFCDVICFGKCGSLFFSIFGDKKAKNSTLSVNIWVTLLKVTSVLVGCCGGGLGVDGYLAHHRIQKNSAILEIT